jgi:hypothetical protein
MLVWAVGRSDLPNWRITRAGITEALRPRATAMSSGHGISAFAAALQGSERRSVGAALTALCTQLPSALLAHSTPAALARLAKYDASWCTRRGTSVDASEPARGVLFAQAATLLGADDAASASWVVQVAGLLGRLKRVSTDQSGSTAGATPVTRKRTRTGAGMAQGALREVLFGSALADRNMGFALWVAAALLHAHEAGHDAADATAAILHEPRTAQWLRVAGNADTAVKRRRPQMGID